MKLAAAGLLHSILLVRSTVAAQQAYLYNFDLNPEVASSSSFNSLDSETANAILVRRLGGTEAFSLGRAGDELLQRLNRYGGQQADGLFKNEDDPSVNRLVVTLQGYDGDAFPGPPSLSIDRADTNLASTSYMESALNGQRRANVCDGSIHLKSGARVTTMIDQTVDPCMSQDELIRLLGGDESDFVHGDSKAIRDDFGNRGARGFRAFIGLDMTRTSQPTQAARNAAIRATFDRWYEALESLRQAGKVESTILILPSRRAPPNLHLGLPRRQAPIDGEEIPLSQPFGSVPSSNNIKPAASSSSSSPSPTHSLHPVGSFLPTCFPNNDTCTDLTNSCSGHGSCYAKSTNCFMCRCGSTIVRQDSDGTHIKSVEWGGSACERKDVSVPFFLFAGFGIAMTAIIVGGIGMMYSMGSETLPSVIGAGVAGPRAK